MAQVKNLISGNKIISFPLTTHCEPLINDDQLKIIYEKMILEPGKIDFIELRALDYSCTLKRTVLNEDFIIHILKLDESEDKTFQKFHGTSIRASIRRAEKKGLSVEINNDKSGLKTFYSLFTKLRKRLGLPILPFQFFDSIFINLVKDDRVFIPVVKYKDIPIAAGIVLKFKDTFYLEYTASDFSRLDLYPNHKLIWEIIKNAIKNKAKFIDFGRTEVNNISLVTFKNKWNTDIKHLKYYKIGCEQGINSLSENSKSFFVNINKHLPKSLLKVQGKVLYKYNG